MSVTTTPVFLRQSVGIDISHLRFDASVGRESRGSLPSLSPSRDYPNTETGFKALIQWVKSEAIDLTHCTFVMEATGVYYESIALWLHEQGYRVAVLLPNSVRSFAKSLNIKTKHDAIDAKNLAHMGCERALDIWEPAPVLLKELKQLTRHRESLLHQRTMAKNQLHAAQREAPLSSKVLESKNQLIEFLSQQIKHTDEQIEALIQSDPQLHQDFQYIHSIPAIGATTAAVLLAETQGFRNFRNQAQLVSYAGYDIIRTQSGTSIKRPERISKKGNHRIRKALFFPSIIAPRHIPAFARVYQRVNQKNAITKMKGAVALQRKLLTLAYQLVKKKAYFDPQKVL